MTRDPHKRDRRALRRALRRHVPGKIPRHIEKAIEAATPELLALAEVNVEAASRLLTVMVRGGHSPESEAALERIAELVPSIAAPVQAAVDAYAKAITEGV